jgi:putative ABC transport system permease protein
LKRTAVGILLGLARALLASRAVQGLLFGVSATDPATYVAVVVLLLAVTLAACLLPRGARRGSTRGCP